MSCRHCEKKIHTGVDGKWIHSESRSVFCDLSATTKAVPR